jgi:hypothetical protein
MGIKFRLYTPDDLPSLSRLWQNSTEWGSLTPEIVARHIGNAPFGKPIISVAEDESTGELVGQVALTASAVSVKGKALTAFRPMAVIFDPGFKIKFLNPLHHPIFQLYGFGLEEVARRRDALVFMLPDPRWRRAIQMFQGMQQASFPLWSIPIPLARPFILRSTYEAAELSAWDQSVDHVFERTAAEYQCMVLRTADALRIKAGPPEYKVLGVHRSGQLVGVVASKQKGDRQWLICDLIATDPEAAAETLKAVCNYANDRPSDPHHEPQISKAGILAVPRLLPILEQLGFERDNYDFHLFVKLFTKEFTQAEVDPSQWYVSAND